MQIYEEANNTALNKVINTEDCSMISGVTEFTTGKTLEKGSGIRGSSSPPLSNQMELERKDDDNEEVAFMDFESKGKKDHSQTNNQMTSSLLLKEKPMVAESITNKESKENQQPDDESEKSEETKERQMETLDKDNRGNGGRERGRVKYSIRGRARG